VPHDVFLTASARAYQKHVLHGQETVSIFVCTAPTNPKGSPVGERSPLGDLCGTSLIWSGTRDEPVLANPG